MIQHMRDYKVSGSTPTGRSKSYSYYMTIAKPGGARRRVRCDVVDEQIPLLLESITIDPDMLPKIRALYHEHIVAIKGPTTDERISDMKKLISKMHTEEAALARLYAQGKLSDKNYDALYNEWKAKLFQAEQELKRLRSGSKQFVDDLEAALVLLKFAGKVFDRLEKPRQKRLLQILVKHIIIDTQGTIIEFEFNPPFMYLHKLKQDIENKGNPERVEGGSNVFHKSPPHMFESLSRSGDLLERFVLFSQPSP